MEQRLNSETIQAFVKKHKIALIVGAVVLGLIMLNDNGGPAMPNGGGMEAPIYGGGGGDEGGFDMDRWRQDQRRDDGVQRDRIDAIREVERCYDPETGRTVEVSIHVGC